MFIKPFVILLFINLSIISQGYNKTKYNVLDILNINNTLENVTKVNSTSILQLKNNSVLPPYLRRKSKFCHFKCDCFFSHNVINDNICINDWIRPPGMFHNSMNDNICVKNWVKYI